MEANTKDIIRERLGSLFNEVFSLNFFIFLLCIPYSLKLAKVSFCVGVISLLIAQISKKGGSFWRSILPPEFLNWPLALFFISAVISTVFSQNFYHSQSIFFERLVPYFLFFIMGIYFFRLNSRNVKLLIWAFIITSIIIGVGGVSDYLLNHPRRLFTVFGKELPFHSLPAFLPYYMPFNFFILLKDKTKWVRIFAGFSLMLLVLCWIWTASRASWIAVPISIIVVLLVAKQKKWVAAVVAICAIIFFLLPVSQRKRVKWIIDNKHWGHRVQLLETSLRIFKESPVVGAGIGMYEELFGQYKPPGKYKKGFKRLHAHNEYMEVLCERGVLGFFTFIWVIGTFLKNGFIAIRETYKMDDGVLTGLVTSLFAVLILSVFSTIINVGTQIAPLFWFLFGATSQLIDNCIRDSN